MNNSPLLKRVQSYLSLIKTSFVPDNTPALLSRLRDVLDWLTKEDVCNLSTVSKVIHKEVALYICSNYTFKGKIPGISLID